MAVYREQPTLQSPIWQSSISAWLRKNLFSSWLNGLVTVALLYLLVPQLWHLIEWAFISADWFGSSRDQCVSGGACWVFITSRLNLFIYGFYPESEYSELCSKRTRLICHDQTKIPLFPSRTGVFSWLNHM